MATSRSYSDACGMAHALDLVGQRWAMHVVRELLLGPKRYSDLRADLPGISTNMLSDRLRELEGSGLVRRRRLPRPAAASVYELTKYGADLAPIITSLGARSPSHRPDLPLSTTAFVLSLRTNFDPARAAGLSASFGLRVGDLDLHARLEDGAFTVEPGTAETPDATLAGSHDTLASLIYDGRNLDDALRDGEVSLSGHEGAALRFLSLFALPDKVAPTPTTTSDRWPAPHD